MIQGIALWAVLQKILQPKAQHWHEPTAIAVLVRKKPPWFHPAESTNTQLSTGGCYCSCHCSVVVLEQAAALSCALQQPRAASAHCSFGELRGNQRWFGGPELQLQEISQCRRNEILPQEVTIWKEKLNICSWAHLNYTRAGLDTSLKLLGT